MTLFLLILSVAFSLEAKVYIDINAPSLERFPIAIPQFMGEDKEGLAQKIPLIIAKDLEFSGLFEIIHQPLTERAGGDE